MSLLKSSYDDNTVKYSPVMMSRAGTAIARAARTARNSPVVKGSAKAGKAVVEGVAEDFAKKEVKDTGNKAWKKGRQLLQITPERPKKLKPARRPRFWEIQTKDDDIKVPKPARTTTQRGGAAQSTQNK